MALLGAWWLARFDRRGLAFFDASEAGFWHSFLAAVIVLPFFAVALAGSFHALGGGDPWRFALASGIGYVLSWAAFPVIIEPITRRMGCRARFPLYIVAYNWSVVVQSAVILPIAIVADLGLLSADFETLLGLAARIFVLAYTWFIARAALAVPPTGAAIVVAIDLLLTLLIGWATAGLS
jgi:hypothetical protein